ncbi:MAG TPA: hypothetical protein PKY28_11045, partial [Ferruginibacter sp.]|nr:hypothetical protein [Ferruginibacter sp.]
MKKVVLLIMGIFVLLFEMNAQRLPLGSKPTKDPCTTEMGFAMLPVAVDTTIGRSVANNDVLWENGDVILVKFMNNAGSQQVRNMIMQHAKIWEQYGNITLKFVPDDTEATNIRIKL